MRMCREDVNCLTDAVYEIFDALVTDALVIGENGILERYKRGEDLAGIITDLIRKPSEEEVESFRKFVDVFSNYEPYEEVKEE